MKYGCINEAETCGAKVIVDGRNVVVPGRENGYFLGPTIIDHVTPDMAIAQEEVFGPVFVIIRTSDVDGALRIEDASLTGRGSTEFWTQAKKMKTKWNREAGLNWIS